MQILKEIDFFDYQNPETLASAVTRLQLTYNYNIFYSLPLLHGQKGLTI